MNRTVIVMMAPPERSVSSNVPAGVERGRYEGSPDSVDDFLRSCCRIGDELYSRVTELWTAYERWARTSGRARVAPDAFNRVLDGSGFEYSRSRRIEGVQTRTWEGLALSAKGAAYRRPQIELAGPDVLGAVRAGFETPGAIIDHFRGRGDYGVTLREIEAELVRLALARRILRISRSGSADRWRTA